jgi:MscS family membrane protein
MEGNNSVNWVVWLEAGYILFGAIFIQQFLLKAVFPRLRRGISHSYRAALIDALERPLGLLIIISGAYLAVSGTFINDAAPQLLSRLHRSAVIVAFFSVLYNLSGNDKKHLTEVAGHFKIRIDPILTNILSGVLRVLTVVFAFLTLAREWNYDISGLVAGLGLGGLALAMASKDSLSNVFGGLIILTDKPFSIGDWIQTGGLEGTVEDVNFRGTRIRTVEQGVIYIPNSSLTNVPITNFSRRSKRRASFTLGLTYATKKRDMEASVREIKQLLDASPELSQAPGDNLVVFEEYGASSLNIRIIFHTLAIDYTGHYLVKEKINLAIFDIVEKLGVAMAFPSQSVYLETPVDVRRKPPVSVLNRGNEP